MVTFKEFIAENRPGIGPHGENSNDKSEKARAVVRWYNE